jgi:hypothetical protein
MSAKTLADVGFFFVCADSVSIPTIVQDRMPPSKGHKSKIWAKIARFSAF